MLMYTHVKESGTYIDSPKQDIGIVHWFYRVNDEAGNLLVDWKKIRERWGSHFKKISTEELSHPPILIGHAVEWPVTEVAVEEVKTDLRKTKPGKATGTDDLPAQLWCSHHWKAAEWLTELFNKITDEGQTPTDWQQSVTVPTFKKKENRAECTNYHPIQILCHVMKIFERFLDQRIHEITQISRNQAGLVKNCGTVDAIHAAKLCILRKPSHCI
ncbi:uncharacterized protein LOC126095426 [Schistocerca cancellata]|uniref:uncharacterized protein LOC126095426 n=1 Tax=Schistocerca cancellata TaxID=274614 RepID=UPI0021184D25|nr:uncharacterized protein LOC126095426 [Schistocerca cancellata]